MGIVTKCRGSKARSSHTPTTSPNCEQVKVILPGAIRTCTIA